MSGEDEEWENTNMIGGVMEAAVLLMALLLLLFIEMRERRKAAHRQSRLLNFKLQQRYMSKLSSESEPFDDESFLLGLRDKINMKTSV
jgi:hypothetical protein